MSDTNKNNHEGDKGKGKNKKVKINFKEKKDRTIKSLNEIEFFLRNIDRAFKYIKLYKILK